MFPLSYRTNRISDTSNYDLPLPVVTRTDNSDTLEKLQSHRISSD